VKLILSKKNILELISRRTNYERERKQNYYKLSRKIKKREKKTSSVI
jgi:hypothetical protein